MQDDDSPTRQIVPQRIRNRIIEYLEVASSYDLQPQYQAAAPVSVPSEMIEQWADWVYDPRSPDYGPPVFSEEEHEAILTYHLVWDDVAEKTPNPLPILEETLRLSARIELRDAALQTLGVFMRRGRLPEDREVRART